MKVKFMEITVLGSGTLLSGKERNPAAYLLEQNKHWAMLDCGPGCLRQLKILGIHLLRIDTIFLSHFHADHCSDVMPLLLARHLVDFKANLKLTLAGPPGLQHWFMLQRSLQGKWLNAALPQVVEMDMRSYQWAGFQISIQATLHSQPCVAFRFDGMHRFFYSADTGYSEALIAFARAADLGLLECSLPDAQKTEGHLTASESGRFARNAGIKKIVLTHIYPSNDAKDLKQRVAQFFPGPITVARDLMKITLE